MSKEPYKILVIGDLHGSDSWLRAIAKCPNADLIVFLGDYVDHWDRSNVEILHNLKQIIKFKEDNKCNVRLLLGNHDFQYLYGSLLDRSYTCSGFRPEAYWDLYDILYKHQDLFEVAFLYKNYLFSHAGITVAWYKRRIADMKRVYDTYHGIGESEKTDVAELLNFTMLVKERDMLWDIGQKRGGMRGDYGSPLWADQQETRFGALRGFTHIVGHTPQTRIKKFEIDDFTSIIYCDAVDKGDNYLTIEIIENDISEEKII